jgi:hypothetical protein
MERLSILVCSEELNSGDKILKEMVDSFKNCDIEVNFEFTYFYDDISEKNEVGYQCVILDQKVFRSEMEMMNFLSSIESLNKSMKIIIIFDDLMKGKALLSELIEKGFNYGIFNSDVSGKFITSLILNKRLDITSFNYYGLKYKSLDKNLESDKLKAIIDYLEGSIDEYLDEDYNYISSVLNDEENILIIKNLSKNTAIKLKKNNVFREYSKWIIEDGSSKEVLVEKEVIKYKEVQIGYKKQIITVLDNYNFALELGYIVAKETDYNVLLLDGDRLNPCMDLVIDIEAKNLLKMDYIQYSNKSGLNQALEAIDKNFDSKEYIYEISKSPKGLDNLHILTGNYDLNNYEYYENENYVSLLDSLYSYYDLVIINSNKFMYDAYTCISLLKSDINIVPIIPRLDKIREINKYIGFLNEKQNIPTDKYKFVGYEYREKVHLQARIVDELTENNYIGTIKYDEKREKYISDSGYFVRKNYSKLFEEYMEILDYLNIVRKKRGFFSKILKR